MNLILADFEAWYTATNTTPYAGNTAEVEYLLEMYLEEIKSVVPVEQANLTKVYDFNACGEFYLACPVWQTYSVKIGEKSNPTNLTLLVLDRDYREQKSHADSQKTIGLDFSCLRCNCKCEFVQIEGIFGYKLPDILVKMIFKLIASFNIPLSGSSDCGCDDDGKVLTSTRTGSVTKTYTITDQHSILSNLKKGYGILEYEPVQNYIRRYKAELIKI